jgi:hypothetical protein
MTGNEDPSSSSTIPGILELELGNFHLLDLLLVPHFSLCQTEQIRHLAASYRILRGKTPKKTDKKFPNGDMDS